MDIGTLLDFTGIRYLWSKISPYIADEYASKADVESIASAVGSGLAFKGAVSAVACLLLAPSVLSGEGTRAG